MQQAICKLKKVNCDQNIIKLKSNHNVWRWRRTIFFLCQKLIVICNLVHLCIHFILSCFHLVMMHKCHLGTHFVYFKSFFMLLVKIKFIWIYHDITCHNFHMPLLLQFLHFHVFFHCWTFQWQWIPKVI
jgi:hypothetical protein